MAESLQIRAQERSREEQARLAAAATEHRVRMPETAAVVDEFRAVFGDVRVAEAEENGHRLKANIKGEDGGDGPRERRNGVWVYR